MSGLAGFLLRIRPALPWILLAAALGAALLAFLLWRAARRAPVPVPGAPVGEEPEPDVDPEASSNDLRRSFAEGLRTLRRYVPGREFRYRIPWVLVLGESGAGKSASLAYGGVERPFADPGEDPFATKRACRWSFFERGVVLDVAGDLFLRAGGRGSDERGWGTLLRLLRRNRPERPVDAVVLTIPATDLYGPRALTREALVARGEAAFAKLWEVQKELGVRFPVYVLVTKCDRVAGFRGLCQALPEPLRDDVFGWSSPYPLEASFAPEWVDEAFASMGRELYEVQVELLGGGEPVRDPDGVFRFPGELARLREPLRSWSREVFRESAYHETFSFRGVYFTGDSEEDLPVSADAPADAAARERRPAFLRRLLEDKVLAERGLVRPAKTASLSRNRTVLAAQILLVLIPLVGGAGAAHGYYRIRNNSDHLAQLLGEVRRDLLRLEVAERDTSRLDAHRVWAEVHAYDLLQNMSEVGQAALWSPFLPSSWAGGLRREVNGSMTAAFSGVVFPAMRSSLLVRADSLLPPT
ncbi:MAG: hypothetical protein JO040_01135, partial [Gemmatimonadetes bacterium]|nr:hypothetical protein [Gemmatimonadota bacterium]